MIDGLWSAGMLIGAILGVAIVGGTIMSLVGRIMEATMKFWDWVFGDRI